MKAEDLTNLVAWLECNTHKISSYLPEKPIDHPVLSKIQIIQNIITSVKSGSLNAIELACDLTIQNKHIPFGKIFKSNIFADTSEIHYLDAKNAMLFLIKADFFVLRLHLVLFMVCFVGIMSSLRQ